MRNNYKYIKDEPDYFHLKDKNVYKLLYNEVGTVPANQEIKWREEWMKHFSPRENSKILELGSHNGPNLIHYAKKGHELVGVELSQTLIKVFEQNIVREDPNVRNNIRIFNSWIENFQIDEKFDYILCTEILEHVIDPIEILKVAEKHLKEDGEIYITSPTSLWGNNTHVRGVPINDLKRWLFSSGLYPQKIWAEDGRVFCYARRKLDYKVYGLIRVRNEAHIINDTLNHLAEFCTGGIFVYDDCSDDETVNLCNNHSSVKMVIKGKEWDSNRERAEYENRATILNEVKKYAGNNDWLVYLDADERIEFNWKILDKLSNEVIAVRMKLFDFYITPQDTHLKYYERNFIGPEYRKIIIAFRNLPELSYNKLDQREVELNKEGIILDEGYVRHYGKALSTELWERKCEYYSSKFAKYSDKWEKRKGKAIHLNRSDFNFRLVKWVKFKMCRL